MLRLHTGQFVDRRHKTRRWPNIIRALTNNIFIMLSTDRPAGNDGDFNLPTRSAAAGARTQDVRRYLIHVCVRSKFDHKIKKKKSNQCRTMYGTIWRIAENDRPNERKKKRVTCKSVCSRSIRSHHISGLLYARAFGSRGRGRIESMRL